MADLSGVTTNFLATASETFEDNLSASITAGAVIVPVNNASEYVNGDIAVITVDAGTNDEATFVGRKNGNQFEDCVWTEGNVSADHASGAPVVDYDSATHYNLVTKALKGIMEQNGKLKADPIREALNLSTASTAGWEVFPNVLQVSSGYNLGAKIYNLTVPNADATSIASQGMALRYERGTTPPANSLDLESSSSQYATKASPSNISFTDDYTLEAIYTLESYTGAEQIIVGRRNGTTEGWSLSVNANGQLVATAQRIAANNRVLTSNRVLPLGEPLHLAVTQDHSGNVHAMYINGESVSFTNTTTGTITAIVQGTSDLRVGALSSAASLYADGRVQEVRVWNTIRTSTQINDNMGQMLTGSETNLVAYYPFSTNLNDLTANANHLTGSGGAAVSAGNVFKATGYARIVSATYSAPNTIIQVYAGDDFIPNMTLNSLFFSTGEAPYGLPQTLQVTSYNLGKRSVKPVNLDLERSNRIGYNLSNYVLPTGLTENATFKFTPSSTQNFLLEGLLAILNPGSGADREFTMHLYVDGVSVGSRQFSVPLASGAGASLPLSYALKKTVSLTPVEHTISVYTATGVGSAVSVSEGSIEARPIF